MTQTVRPATDPSALPITVRPVTEPIVTETTVPVTRAAGDSIAGLTAATAPAPAPVNAPMAPMVAEAATLVYTKIPDRSLTTTPVSITGMAVELRNRSIAAPTLAVTGMAFQLLQRNISAPPIVIQGY